MEKLGLSDSHLMNEQGQPTDYGENILAYFKHRADVLNTFVESCLMDAARAKALFDQLQKKLRPRGSVPMNKQKGEKKAPAYFTACINMLIEANLGALPCNYDPRELTTVTFNNAPLRTLAQVQYLTF